MNSQIDQRSGEGIIEKKNTKVYLKSNLSLD